MVAGRGAKGEMTGQPDSGARHRAGARLQLRSDFAPKPGCACRKLDSDILMMKSAQDWATKNVPGAIDGR